MKRLLPLLLLACAAHASDSLVFVGSYTDSGSKGIYAFRLQMKKGRLERLGVAAETSNPSFLVESLNHHFLYAVNENGGARQMGSVSAFAIDASTGKLTLLNWVSSRGGAPCHLALDRTGRWLAVANYEGASVAILPAGADGKLGPPLYLAQTGGHAAGVAFSPDNRFLLAADSGKDGIYVYRFDPATGSLTIHNPPGTSVKPGSGVRHIAFHPSGKELYAINELSSTVTVFDWDAVNGVLHEGKTLTTLPGFSAGNKAAELALNSDASLLYVSNRGHDSIYSFTIDPHTLALSAAEDFPTLGRTPRHFALDPTGQYLVAANEDTNDLMVFKIHGETGQLAPVGKLIQGVPKPACVVFVEADR